jgi:hypothetical protein
LNDTKAADPGFDFRARAVHHESVKPATRAIILFVAAVLLTWHGVLLATPHNHDDTVVPREEIACSASHPSSQANHVHSSGRHLSRHPCVACLAGSTVADASGIAKVDTETVGVSIFVVMSSDLRPRLHSHLPHLRGPPLTS